MALLVEKYESEVCVELPGTDGRYSVSSLGNLRRNANNRPLNPSVTPDACKKMVLNTVTGIYYDTVKEAAESASVSAKHLSNMLSGFRRNRTFLIAV